VPGVLAATAGSDWTEGGALFTFYFPVGLFIVVAAALYLGFSRPHAIPGREPLTAAVAARPAATAPHGKDAAPPPSPPAADSASPGERAAEHDHEAPSADA
jgi:hypothetical protein